MVAASMSTADYFRQLIDSPVKLEWANGVVTEMAGASRAHGEISLNLNAQVLGDLNLDEWKLYGPDVAVEAAGAYRFPDASLVKSPERAATEIAILLNPVVLFEITSLSTGAVDRGAKLREYRQIGSLLHYVIIDGSEKSIDVYSRQGADWTVRTVESGEWPLVGTPVSLNVDGLYRDAL